MEDETAFEPHIGAQCSSDAAIAALAERQHGLVARWQLLGMDVGRRAIGRRVERGRLHVVHRGVYAVGHRVLSRQGWWMAAVLAEGPGAALSHRAAGALWEVRQWAGRLIEVTVDRKRRSRLGIQVHHAALRADEVTTRDGIPVTTVPRTLLDLAAVLPRHQVERALNEAELRQLTDPLSLGDLVSRYPGRPGTPTIRALLGNADVGASITRSELENRFLAFVDHAALPRPVTNLALSIAGRWIEADCVWHPARLIVELDGHASHGTAAAYERDRARDRALAAAGWRVVRVTWRQLHDEPDALAADLRALLANAGSGAPATTA